MTEVLAAEARFWWRCVWPPFKWTVLVAVVVFIVSSLESTWSEPAPTRDDWIAAPVVGIVCGIYVGGILGLVFGATHLLWRLVGGWILLPLILIPAGIALSVWGMQGWIEGRADHLWEALRGAASEHDWQALKAGPAARAGPVVLIILLPLLLLDVGVLLLTPSVFAQLLALVGVVALTLVLGAIPPAVMSAVALSVAFVRRFRRRHAQ